MSFLNYGLHWTQISPYNLDMFWFNVYLHSTSIFHSGPNFSCRLSKMIFSSSVNSISDLSRLMPLWYFNFLMLGICFINSGRGPFNYLKICGFVWVLVVGGSLVTQKVSSAWLQYVLRSPIAALSKILWMTPRQFHPRSRHPMHQIWVNNWTLLHHLLPY